MIQLMPNENKKRRWRRAKDEDEEEEDFLQTSRIFFAFIATKNGAAEISNIAGWNFI